MKILLVDDDQELTSFLSMELEDMGHFIEVANDGISGEDLALKKPYDVIILDLMLPGTDGYNICQNIREHRIMTPVLMISSLDSNKDKKAGFSAGANEYMAKPFQFDELYDKIILLDNKHRS